MLLIRVGASRPAAALGLALYAGVFWTVKFSFYSPAYVGAATQLFLLLILLLLAENRYGLAVPVLMLGVLQKESVAVLDKRCLRAAHRTAATSPNRIPPPAEEDQRGNA